MQKLGPEYHDRLTTLFAELVDRDIRYVVLRKHELLPDAVADDVDLLVDSAAFDEAIALCERLGFGPPTDDDTTPLQRAVRQPFRTASTVLRDPATVRNAFRNGGHGGDGSDGTGGDDTGGDDTGDTAPERRKLVSGPVELDLVDHLCAPEITGARVPSAVERALLDRRRRRDGVFVPAPADELAHIVAHCLADYDGEFPPYYVCRCDTLRETVEAHATVRARFREQLDRLFGDEADRVEAAIHDGTYWSLEDVEVRTASRATP